jgi:type I restriction enzyme S subunit
MTRSARARQTQLGECCEIVSGATPRTDRPEYWGGDIRWATPRDLSDLQTPVLYETAQRITRDGYHSCSTLLLPMGAVLFTSRAPVGLVAIAGAPMCTNQGFKTLVPGPDVDSGYLYWWLRRFAPAIESRGNGTTFTEVSKAVVSRFEIVLPPLSEQRRIASTLDMVGSILRKRQESLHLLDEFLRSAFFAIFGDVARNEKRWEVTELRDVLSIPLRNGISPSKGGVVRSTVLTLAAVTGEHFDARAIKEATFERKLSDEDRVDPRDFLICRGNGNRALMGRAKFPSKMSPDVIFPDTIIAARIDQSRVNPEYLQALWTTPLIRRVLESRGRTTSGIHKINQQALESISFPLPPLDEQVTYARAAQAVQRVRQRYIDRQWVDLFDSVAGRAFSSDE